MFKTRSTYPVITDMFPNSPIQEAYRKLRTNLNYVLEHHRIKTILITSSIKGEGKSITTANLGAAFALEGKEVVLIDCDMRKPSLHQIFAKSNRTGLMQILEQSCTVPEAIRETDIPHLSVITSGGTPIYPTELLSSRRMNALLEELSGRYDIILIDSPPASVCTDAQVLAGKCDGLVFVVGNGKVKSRLAVKMKEEFEASGVRMLGAILNHANNQEERYLSGYGVNN